MKTQPPVPATCTTSEAAKELGISVRAAQLWVESGLLRAWKTPGGHRRILRSSLAQIIKQQKVVSHQRGGDGLSILVIEASQPERESLGAALLAGFPNSQIRLAMTALESLLSIGEQAPDILIANLDALDVGRIRGSGGDSQSAHLAGTLFIGLAADQAAIPEIRRQLPAEFILLGKPAAFEELQALIRAFIQGRQNQRREA